MKRKPEVSFSSANRRRLLPEGHKEITAQSTFSVEEENNNKVLRNDAHTNDDWFPEYRPPTPNRHGHERNLGHARRSAFNHALFGGLKKQKKSLGLSRRKLKLRAKLRSPK
jgi:hypothetical protein